MRIMSLFVSYLILLFMLLFLQSMTNLPVLSLGVGALSLALLTHAVQLLRNMRK